jgi:hypothetical protein
MYTVRGIKKNCSTCEHWAGLRAMDEGGFVYSLENVEGICKGSELDRPLTPPAACCTSWEKWSDLLSCTNFPQESNARSAAAYSI